MRKPLLQEEAVPSSADYRPACGQAELESNPKATHRARGFWPSIAWIALVEVVVLLALAGVFVAYLNWSSEASFAEFLAATNAQAASTLPLTEVRPPCKPGA